MKHSYFTSGIKELRLIFDQQGPEAAPQTVPDEPKPAAVEQKEQSEVLDDADAAKKVAERESGADAAAQVAKQLVEKVQQDASAAGKVDLAVMKKDGTVLARSEISLPEASIDPKPVQTPETKPAVEAQPEAAAVQPVEGAPEQADALVDGAEKAADAKTDQAAGENPDAPKEKPKTKANEILNGMKEDAAVLKDPKASAEDKLVAFMSVMSKFGELFASFKDGSFKNEAGSTTAKVEKPADASAEGGADKTTEKAPEGKNERREKLKTELKDKKDIQELIDSKNTDVKKNTDRLHGEIDGLDAEITTLEKGTTDINQKIRDMEQSIPGNPELKSKYEYDISKLKIDVDANTKKLDLAKGRRDSFMQELQTAESEPKKDIDELNKMKDELAAHAEAARQGLQILKESADGELKTIIDGISVEVSEKNYEVRLNLTPDSVQKLTDITKKYEIDMSMLGLSNDNSMVKGGQEQQLIKILGLIAEKMKPKVDEKAPDANAGSAPTEAPSVGLAPAAVEQPATVTPEQPVEVKTADATEANPLEGLMNDHNPMSGVGDAPEAPAAPVAAPDDAAAAAALEGLMNDHNPMSGTPDATVEQPVDIAAETEKQANVLMENVESRAVLGLRPGNPEMDHSLQELTDLIRTYRQKGGNETEQGRVIAESVVKKFNESMANLSTHVELAFNGEDFGLDTVGPEAAKPTQNELPLNAPPFLAVDTATQVHADKINPNADGQVV